jgi:hypothetical protein
VNLKTWKYVDILDCIKLPKVIRNLAAIIYRERERYYPTTGYKIIYFVAILSLR